MGRTVEQKDFTEFGKLAPEVGLDFLFAVLVVKIPLFTDKSS